MNYFVFQVSDQSAYGKQKTAREVFDFLVRDHSVWGFGHNTPNRKAIQVGDKVLFYLTGSKNQVLVGAAVLASTPYQDTSGESSEWYLDPSTLRIDLTDVLVFPEPKPRKSFASIEWRPAQGGSSKISEEDYNIIMGYSPDELPAKAGLEVEDETTFALEKYLEEFIVDNWKNINFGQKLTLYIDDDGNTGQQYYTKEVGYLDILAIDKNENFVVIELKKGRKNDEVVGQVLRYMGWVRNNLAKPTQNVTGLIIVGERDTKLDYALSEMSDKISAMVYQVSFKLHNY
ncbi:MAG TPA: PDDEXK nuclease domain-containing protein [Candidatus Saccharimonadales bacterium]|nr:PDDEXK nuclease domain-containing protein [Candidatus Saccharimonadales bacterium]